MLEKKNRENEKTENYMVRVSYGEKRLEDCMKKVIQTVTKYALQDRYAL